MKSKIVLFFFVMSLIAFAAETEHGIFMRTVKNIKGNYNEVCNQVKQSMQSAGFKLLADHDITSPDRVKKDKKNLCGYKGKLFVFTSDDYVKMLTSFGNKYLAASFLRVGVHETNEGIQIIIADPKL